MRALRSIGPLFFSLLLILGDAVSAQDCAPLPFIRGLTVYGGANEENLPLVVVKSGKVSTPHADDYPFITIRFDVAEPGPPRLQITFHHCDRDWKPDENFVVRDEFYSFTRMLNYEAAPPAAREYTFRYLNSFPSKDHPFVRFLYSGNWLFDIVDERDTRTVFATGRFIVVEDLVRTNLQAFNDYWTEWDPPRDRVHRLQLDVTIPKTLFPDFVETVDLYRNRNLFDNYRVKSFDFKRNARVEGIGMREKSFVYLNVPPVNGYRFLDIRSPGAYPSGARATRFGGPDFTRYRFGTDVMHLFGGASTLPSVNADADYVCVRFELATPEIPDANMFVAGAFNNWDPQLDDKMLRDPTSGNYVLDKWLLRGTYDYQYVVGRYDAAAGYVKDADWITLEGNDWDAGNLYWGIVYYSDDQFGGITRAVGFALRYPRHR